jgi:hypothetical protein
LDVVAVLVLGVNGASDVWVDGGCVEQSVEVDVDCEGCCGGLLSNANAFNSLWICVSRYVVVGVDRKVNKEDTLAWRLGRLLCEYNR